MEQQRLPNAMPSIILGIISFVACCFSSGFGGVLLSGIALFLANKDRKRAAPNPEQYENYTTVKTARIIAIVGLILSILTVILTVVMLIIFGGVAGIEEYMREMQANAQ